ncbi:MAG: prohibitin family protein [Oscillospiraceae bacterium]|nr:prohibitin family protein [Oscillospiraceae bacterium]MCL2279866.1 prohibitin family protein [Oscillospiraceae bacterium]
MKSIKTWIILGVFVLLVIILAAASIRIVPPGHTGVRVLAGQVRGQTTEGLRFVVPFVEQMQMMNNRTVAMEMSTEAVTRDLQAVRMNYIVNYQLNTDASANVFRTIGSAYESIVLRPIVEETLKDITARYAIEELITERARVSADITSALQVAFTTRGFTLERFNIVDFHFSPEFSVAIEQVRIAEQNALRAEQDLARVEFEAEADRERARAQADVLRLQAQELTDTNLAAMWLETWNGVLPVFVAGDSQGIMINFEDIQGMGQQPTVEVGIPAQTEQERQQQILLQNQLENLLNLLMANNIVVSFDDAGNVSLEIPED